MSNDFVGKVRKSQVSSNATSPETNDLQQQTGIPELDEEEEQEETRTGKDGKQYPVAVKEPISPNELE